MNKTDTSLSYDNADRLTGITHQFIPSMGGSTTLATYSYSYNAANEVTSQTNSDGTLNYAYDATGQLTSVTGAFSESYSYDVNGNRTMSGYTTGTANRLTSDGVHNFTYSGCAATKESEVHPAEAYISPVNGKKRAPPPEASTKEEYASSSLFDVRREAVHVFLA